MLRDEAAAEAGADWETLYEEAPCGYLTTSPDGTIRNANRTLLGWLRRDRQELVGRRRFYDLLPPGAKIYYETTYAPLLLMQGRVRELAFELVRADGSRLPVLVNAKLTRDADEQPQLVLITVFDASERRRYERELLHARAEAEARAAAAVALAHVVEAVVLVDDDERVQLLNRAAERLLGVDGGEAQGLPLASLAAGWPTVAPRIPVGTPEAPPRPLIVPLELHGRTRWLAAAGQTASEGIVYTLRDVTEERELEHLRDDIVAVVSHELRTPLAGIYGAAQTLGGLADRLDEEARRQLIGVIGDQSERMTRILEQMRLSERLDHDELAAEQLSFDAGELTARVCAAAQASHPARPVELTAADGVVARADPRLFEQVLLILLENAFAYSPADTDVRVRVERRRTHARVTVSDSGPGIPAADRERVFERFSRLDVDHMSGAAGAGLGLYIARELAKRMRGRLDLLEADGGALFALDLPLAPV